MTTTWSVYKRSDAGVGGDATFPGAARLSTGSASTGSRFLLLFLLVRIGRRYEERTRACFLRMRDDLAGSGRFAELRFKTVTGCFFAFSLGAGASPLDRGDTGVHFGSAWSVISGEAVKALCLVEPSTGLGIGDSQVLATMDCCFAASRLDLAARINADRVRTTGDGQV